MSLSYLVFVPYLMIALGLLLGLLRIRPALLSWGTCALGVLAGIAIAVTMIASNGFDLLLLAGISLLPAVAAAMMVAKDLSYPRINDVTTDVDNPPEFETALKAAPNIGRKMTFPKRFGPIIRDGYPDLKPLMLNQSPEASFERISRLVADQSGWAITRQDLETHTLEGEATTSFLGFVDDFIIRVSNQDGKSRIDMRSKSREGLVDAGKNAKRIRQFLMQLSKYP